jgi:hypothetical protein
VPADNASSPAYFRPTRKLKPFAGAALRWQTRAAKRDSVFYGLDESEASALTTGAAETMPVLIPCRRPSMLWSHEYLVKEANFVPLARGRDGAQAEGRLGTSQ